MKTFPLALRIEGRRVLVVGGGVVALEKTRGLVEAGADVDVVAPNVHPDLRALDCRIHVREFSAEDVEGAWLVFAAAPPDVNRAVKEAADVRQTFLVSVDDVASCSAFGMARIVRGDVTIAIGTGGRAPALSALLRRALERLVPDEVESWARLAARERKKEGSQEQRRALLRDLLLENVR